MSLLRFKALTVDVVGTLIDSERGLLDFLHQAAADAEAQQAQRIAEPLFTGHFAIGPT